VQQRLIEARTKAEAGCRAALASDDAATARLDLLIGLLARWIPVRESMAAEFTLAWPTLRGALGRLGDALVERGTLTDPVGVYELTREEVEAALAGTGASLQAAVEERRAERRARSTLTPPLSLGKPVRQWKQVDAISAVLRTEPPAGAQVIVSGIGSSPGSVTGVARVVLGPDQFDSFQPGEILVAPATAPGWTPILAIAAGAVTDGGGPFAHTSVVARELGIPAIVTATGATSRIRTGDVITLDAASGTVSSSCDRT
jgi:pyruvate,water dikinase